MKQFQKQIFLVKDCLKKRGAKFAITPPVVQELEHSLSYPSLALF